MSSSDVPSDWRQQEAANLHQWIAQWQPGGDRDVELSVSCVAQLDEKTLLVGGSYRTPAASVRSVLLQSDDAGKTWRDTGVWLTGSDTGEIFVLDAKHAWAAVNWSTEGWLPPFAVFRTADGGKTWQRSTQNLPLEGANAGIPLDFGLRFASPDIGIAWIVGSCGDYYHYLTTDGGATWRLVHHYKIETYDDMPDPPRLVRNDDGSTSILLRNPLETESRVINTLQSNVRLREDGTAEPVDKP